MQWSTYLGKPWPGMPDVVVKSQYDRLWLIRGSGIFQRSDSSNKCCPRNREPSVNLCRLQYGRSFTPRLPSVRSVNPGTSVEPCVAISLA